MGAASSRRQRRNHEGAGQPLPRSSWLSAFTRPVGLSRICGIGSFQVDVRTPLRRRCLQHTLFQVSNQAIQEQPYDPGMLICPFCHTKVPHGAVVCSGCGAEARYGCSNPGCGCVISLIAGFVFWSSFSHLFKLVLTPDKIRALPLWLLNLQNNASILGVDWRP